MEKEKLSAPKELPELTVTWWALGLALLSLLLLAAMVVIFRINPQELGWLDIIMVLNYVSLFAGYISFGLSIRSLRSGERSWVAFVSAVISALMSAFWLYTLFDQSLMFFLAR